MLIPQITFNEANVGSAPIQPNVRNRIGLVGEFSRGPANVFQYLDGFTQFSTEYGSDNRTGSVGFQAAWDQGARDFGIVRVLGRAKPACGQIIIGGVANADNNIDFKITGLGEPVAELDTFFRMDVQSNGVYEGSETGRYVFAVTDATSGAIVIKWKFFSQALYPTRESAADAFTQAVKDTIVDNSNAGEGILYVGSTPANDFDETPGGILTTVAENGINILFGDAGDTLYFTVGQTFTVIAEIFNYNIPVNAGDTAVEVGNNFVNLTQGADPLGTVTQDLTYIASDSNSYTSTIDFCFDESLLNGAQGNNYSYNFNLTTPELVYYFDDMAWDDDAVGTAPGSGAVLNTVLFTQDAADAAAILAAITATPGSIELVSITGGTTTKPAGTILVTNVVETGVGTGIYEIVLDTALTGTDSGDITFGTGPGPLVVNFEDVNGGLSLTGYQVNTGFTGGVDGPRAASRDLYTFNGTKLIQVVALSQGAWGNNLRLDIDALGGPKWQLLE